MEKASGGGGKPVTRFGFDFSWADEVEREEREQQEEEQISVQRQEIKKEQTKGKADPFGAARPREVVLAEKGVDWRAWDRELNALAPRRSSRCVAASDARASIRVRVVATPARAGPTPARRAAWGACPAGPTPHSRGQAAETIPWPKVAPPVSRSAWGGGKRKCAGEAPAPATGQRVRAVRNHGRRVFGEINVSEGCGSSLRSAAKKGRKSGRGETENKESEAATVAEDGGGNSGSRPTAATATATKDHSAGVQKRKGRKRGRGGSKKTEPANSACLGELSPRRRRH